MAPSPAMGPTLQLLRIRPFTSTLLIGSFLLNFATMLLDVCIFCLYGSQVSERSRRNRLLGSKILYSFTFPVLLQGVCPLHSFFPRATAAIAILLPGQTRLIPKHVLAEASSSSGAFHPLPTMYAILASTLSLALGTGRLPRWMSGLRHSAATTTFLFVIITVPAR